MKRAHGQAAGNTSPQQWSGHWPNRGAGRAHAWALRINERAMAMNLMAEQQDRDGFARRFGSLDLEGLSPDRFEDLLCQLAYRFRAWRVLDASGVTAADGGLVIRGLERGGSTTTTLSSGMAGDEDATAPGREWMFFSRTSGDTSAAALRALVEEAVAGQPPHGLVVALPGEATAPVQTAFREAVRRYGIIEGHLWSRRDIERMLALPEHDHLLFAYFGLSTGHGRPSRQTRVHDRIRVKRQLLEALHAPTITRRLLADVLVRDVEDTAYPSAEAIPGFIRLTCPPWHAAIIERALTDGLLVRRFAYDGWVRPDGSWDLIEETASVPSPLGLAYRQRLSDGADDDGFAGMPVDPLLDQVPVGEHVFIYEAWTLPFDHIAEVDRFGDPIHPGPHIYCHFTGEDGPYMNGPVYFAARLGEGTDERLALDRRAPLFRELADRATAPPQTPPREEPAEPAVIVVATHGAELPPPAVGGAHPAPAFFHQAAPAAASPNAPFGEAAPKPIQHVQEAVTTPPGERHRNDVQPSVAQPPDVIELPAARSVPAPDAMGLPAVADVAAKVSVPATPPAADGGRAAKRLRSAAKAANRTAAPAATAPLVQTAAQAPIQTAGSLPLVTDDADEGGPAGFRPDLAAIAQDTAASLIALAAGTDSDCARESLCESVPVTLYPKAAGPDCPDPPALLAAAGD